MDSPELNSSKKIFKWIAGSFVIGSLLIPILISVIQLWFEYHSGLFIANQDNTNTFDYFFIFIIAVFLTRFFFILSILFFIFYLFINLLKEVFVREEYAFTSLFFFISSVLLTFFSFSVRLMPWNKNLWDEISSIPTQSLHWSELVLLGVCCLILNYFVVSKYFKWDGQISKNEFNKKRKNVDFLSAQSFFIDGFKQFFRCLTFSPLLERYKEESSRDLITQLSPVTESLAWYEQARDLISLKNPSFDFDPENSWRSSQKIWVGRNIDTNKLIFLCPRHEQTKKKEIDNICKFAQTISNEKEVEIGKIIIATKDKISSQFTKRNFNIEYVTEDLLLCDLVDFRDYLYELKRRVTRETLPDSDLTLNDVYVESKISKSDLSPIDEKIEDFLNLWISESNQKHLALLGEYGQGKSTATLMWAYKTLSNSISSRIPILIELRGKSPRNMDILGILGDWAARYKINAQALMKLHIAGRLVLIFEGFDEMALVGDSDMRLKHFRTLWEFAYPKAKILITGRPNFFLDDNELKAALGISNPVVNSPYGEAIRLAPFDKDQISVALRNHNQTIKNQIIQLITDKPDSRLAELVSRPSLLHIVSTLWIREKLYEKVEQLNSAFVMDLFVRHSYTRQGLKESGSPEFMALTTSERQYFMSGIATSMSSEGSNQITTTQLSEIIRKLIEYIPDSVSKESQTIRNEIKVPLKDRIKQSEFTEEHIKTDVRTCGLLVDDPTVGNGFRFGHKSFMEFLFAKVVASQLIKKTSATTAIMQATNSNVESILKFPTSIEFLNDLALTELQKNEKNLERISNEKYLSLLFLYHISKNKVYWLLLIKYFAFIMIIVEEKLLLEKNFL